MTWQGGSDPQPAHAARWGQRALARLPMKRGVGFLLADLEFRISVFEFLVSNPL